MGLVSGSSGGRVRVLHLISDAGPHPYFELIGDHTDRDRFDVRLATVSSAGALHEDAERMSLPSFALGADSRLRYPDAVVRLAKRLRRDGIDVLQTHLLDGCVVGLTAAKLARTPATIFTAHHSHEIPLHDRWLLSAVDRLCARGLSDAIISPSAQMRETLLELHGVSREKIRVIHHGFELDRLDPAGVDPSGVRSELGLDGHTVLTAVGRIYWIKNQEALVRAFAGIAGDAPSAVLLLVGAGDEEATMKLASSLGIGRRVRMLPRRPDVPELLAATDLFVHPALAESFAMVIVEAMAMGCPVVSTPVGIAPDVVENGVTGVLADGCGPAELESALREALWMRQRWPAMGNAARERALGFPAERMVRTYESLYLELLGRGSTARADPRPDL
jgi:glycosyltransferase involved in cell wall biosynthesis